MKKIFSLVALVGIFALMSFGEVSVTSNNNDKKTEAVELSEGTGEGATKRSDCRALSHMIADYYGLGRHGRRAVFHNCMETS